MRLVLFEFGPDQKLEETQDSSLKCLGQLAQIPLDSAVLAVRPANIDKRPVQPVVYYIPIQVLIRKWTKPLVSSPIPLSSLVLTILYPRQACFKIAPNMLFSI